MVEQVILGAFRILKLKIGPLKNGLDFEITLPFLLFFDLELFRGCATFSRPRISI